MGIQNYEVEDLLRCEWSCFCTSSVKGIELWLKEQQQKTYTTVVISETHIPFVDLYSAFMKIIFAVCFSTFQWCGISLHFSHFPCISSPIVYSIDSPEGLLYWIFSWVCCREEVCFQLLINTKTQVEGNDEIQMYGVKSN